MALVIVERRVGDIVVLDAVGSLTVQAGTHTLSRYVHRCLDAGHQRFVVSLRDIADCDTGGIGALVTSLTHVTGRGGRLILANMPPNVRQMLQAMKLYEDFDTSMDETAAVRALGGFVDP